MSSSTPRRHRFRAARSNRRSAWQGGTGQDKPGQASLAHLQPPLPPGPGRPRSARLPTEQLPAAAPLLRPRRAPRSAANRAQAAPSRHIAHPRRRRRSGPAAAPHFRPPARRFRSRGGAVGTPPAGWGAVTAAAVPWRRWTRRFRAPRAVPWRSPAW